MTKFFNEARALLKDGVKRLSRTRARLVGEETAEAFRFLRRTQLRRAKRAKKARLRESPPRPQMSPVSSPIPEHELEAAMGSFGSPVSLFGTRNNDSWLGETISEFKRRFPLDYEISQELDAFQAQICQPLL